MNVLAAAGLVAVLLLGALPVMVVSAAAQPAEGGCAAPAADSADSAPVAAMDGLSGEQLAHAATIIRVGRHRQLPDQGIVVALATALQESRLVVYANDGLGGDLAPEQHGIAASLELPHEAFGTDHGSLGIFQQQWPWWGTMRDLMDPATSAGRFYDALTSVPGWQALPVTVAAQSVQSSADPAAYADDEPLARRLLADVDGDVVAAVDCAPLVEAGEVVLPLPSGSGYVDQHNFGDSGPSWASSHTGTDLSAACGTPVLAATSGTVHIDHSETWAGEWLVQVSTGPERLTTWHAHLQRVDVSNGDSVASGQRLGEVGELGNATGCHLHFEVHPHGGSIYEDPVDPTVWLQQHLPPAGQGSA